MANDLSAQLQARFGGLSDNSADSASSQEGARDTYAELTRLISAVTGVAEGLEREAVLEDLGVESLERIELAVRAEEAFGVRLTEGVMKDVTTVGDLADYLEAHRPAE